MPADRANFRYGPPKSWDDRAPRGRIRTPRKSRTVKGFTWDQLLDGEPHVIDLNLWMGPAATLRAKLYNEAYARALRARTSVDGESWLWVQAHNPWSPSSAFYASAEMYLEIGRRANARVPEPDDEPNPYTIRLDPDNDHAPCTCGSVGQLHTASCAAVTDR